MYCGRDLQLNRIVAPKVPRRDRVHGAQRDSVDRFCWEARAAAAVRHPHICLIYDTGEAWRFRERAQVEYREVEMVVRQRVELMR